MDVVEKNLSQEQFTQFYHNYIHGLNKVALAEWIIRIMPNDMFKQIMDDMNDVRGLV